MAKEITIEFNGDGSPPKVEAHGFLGSGCKAATQDIEQALGKVVSRKDKGLAKVGQSVKIAK